MHIAIHALHYRPGASGGSETYLLGLVQELRSYAGEHRITLLILPEAEGDVRPLRDRGLEYRVVNNVLPYRALRAALRALDRTQPAGWLANIRPDVIHFPNAVIRMRPFPRKVAMVLTMTDIQHEFHPEFWPAADVRLRKRLFPASIDRADAIIAISEFTRQGLIERMGCPSSKVRTIYPGVDDALLSAPLTPEHWQQTRTHYGLPERFLIYPAGTWPHKNHVRLIRALGILAQENKSAITVVLTGIRQFAHQAMLDEIDKQALRQRVLHLGHVPRDDMATILRRARGLIFPSLFEGFGLPVVEAMAAGCPVACSDRAALPEIAGEAALYFDPTDLDAIADAVWRLWEDDDAHRKLATLGRARARLYDWRAAAAQTMEVYRSVVPA
jgi:glycosyltransferase involved in cell wall biosynthesis